MTGTGEQRLVELPVVPVGLPALLELLGLDGWQWRVARRRGLLHGPDGGPDDARTWSPDLVVTLLGEVDAVREVVGTAWPVGLQRTAERLAGRTVLPVTPVDVEELVARGLLHPCKEFVGDKGRRFPLYAACDTDAVDAAVVEEIVTARTSWVAASVPDVWAAAEYLGWRVREVEQVARERGLAAGRGGRWAKADLDGLKQDAELVARVERERLIGADQAAKRLRIRPSDWRWVEPAGWIAPADHTWMKVGRERHVRCRLYRTEDVDALLEIPVEWDEVQACGPGDPSPLRKYAPKLPPTRGEVIRRWIAEYGHLTGVDVWARYDGRRDTWTLDWELVDGEPTAAAVREAAAAEPALAPHLGALVFGSSAGEVTRWAREMLEPGAAVVLDTETTGLRGAVVEIAVIDAATGAVLLDTLVNPGDVPMEPQAQAVHGITMQALADAPTWDKVVAKVRKATRGKVVLAYNAEFDRARIGEDCRRYGVKPMHLGDPTTWSCVMNRRSDYLGIHRWVALGGGHRALGDCRSARDVLIRMAGQSTSTARGA